LKQFKKEERERLEKSEREKLGTSNNNNNSSKFADGIKSLEEMGFCEKEKNIQLMIKHNGDVMRVVQDLLNN